MPLTLTSDSIKNFVIFFADQTQNKKKNKVKFANEVT